MMSLLDELQFATDQVPNHGAHGYYPKESHAQQHRTFNIIHENDDAPII
jgi:hypothetical protein